ncbi:MAG TPA: hypothetical protein VF823_05190 [Anaerolineales bacterium]
MAIHIPPDSTAKLESVKTGFAFLSNFLEICWHSPSEFPHHSVARLSGDFRINPAAKMSFNTASGKMVRDRNQPSGCAEIQQRSSRNTWGDL